MPKSISELKDVWKKDCEVFKVQELGGLQDFVADVFECQELFNIKRGLESTKFENRQNEFIKERNKNGRRADIIIFYKGNEIVIPVEIEKYCNIENGVKQLADYQNDYQKAYGILTDGFEWRFYNNTVYKKFTLFEIFDNPSMLKTFWEEYLKEENYYLNFFEKTGQLHFDFIEETLKIEENRELFFEDITNLIQKFKDKLGIVGYLEEKGTPNSDKKATEIAYAYFIQFILYKNLVDNAYTYIDDKYNDFTKEFDVRIGNIYNCLKNKSYHGIATQIYGISNTISDKLYKPFNKEQEFINNKLQEILCKPDVVLEEISLWLDIIVFIKKYNFTNMRNEIFGYIYENYLKELYEENNKGQYFTDPAVVNFMLDEIGYTTKEIRKLYDKKQLDKLSIIDPSCGSGTFLYSAVYRIVEALFDGTEKRSKEIEEIINNNVFGLDIAEFPLYLAEMNILMRMLPIIFNEDYTNPIDKKIKIFKTQDSITEFMDTGISCKDNKKVNEKTGQLLLFAPETLDLSYNSYIRDEDDLKEMKESMRPPRRRFDFVIGNPPYIGYNECCKQKILFTQIKEIKMNNIYGVNLNTVPGYQKQSPKPNLYAYFIALGGALLKPNGKMCYIIPQTLLNSMDLDVIRYFLSKELTIEKIITFSGELFKGRGIKCKKSIATSNLIFIVERKSPKENQQVEIINYLKNNEEEIENILKSKGNNKRTYFCSQQDLYKEFQNWNFITKNEEENFIRDTYISNSISIDEYRKSLIDYDLVQFDKGLAPDKTKVVEEEKEWQLIKKESDRYNIGLQNKYISTENIKIPGRSQGINVFRNKYKIVWSYMNYDKFYFSDKNIMFNQNWVLISSNDIDEVLYLFAILNSSISRYIIRYYMYIPHEKSINTGIKTIKNYIRIPLNTDENNLIKKEIIKYSQKLLDIENTQLKDLIDFSTILIQKFDSYKVEEKYLILYKENQEYRLNIKDTAKNEYIKAELYKKYPELATQLNLTELKNLVIIDKNTQDNLKERIDKLVFKMYFGVAVEENNGLYSDILSKIQ